MANKNKSKKKQLKCGCDDGYVYYGSGCSSTCDQCDGLGWYTQEEWDAKKKRWAEIDAKYS